MAKKVFIVDLLAAFKADNSEASRNCGRKRGVIRGRVGDERLEVHGQDGTAAVRRARKLRESAGAIFARVPDTTED